MEGNSDTNTAPTGMPEQAPAAAAAGPAPMNEAGAAAAEPVQGFRPGYLFQPVRFGEADAAEWRVTWEFLTDIMEGARMITDTMAARSRMERGIKQLYIGRKNGFGGVTSMRFSLFQGTRLKMFLDEVLDQMDVYGDLLNNRLIPHFVGDYGRAFQCPSRRNTADFWSQADVDVGIKARLVFDTNAGKYRLWILSPADVPRDRYANWLGPQLSFLGDEMKAFRTWLITQRQLEQ